MVYDARHAPNESLAKKNQEIIGKKSAEAADKHKGTSFLFISRDFLYTSLKRALLQR